MNEILKKTGLGKRSISQIKLTVSRYDAVVEITGKAGKTLMELLRDNDV